MWSSGTTWTSDASSKDSVSWHLPGSNAAPWSSKPARLTTIGAFERSFLSQAHVNLRESILELSFSLLPDPDADEEEEEEEDDDSMSFRAVSCRIAFKNVPGRKTSFNLKQLLLLPPPPMLLGPPKIALAKASFPPLAHFCSTDRLVESPRNHAVALSGPSCHPAASHDSGVASTRSDAAVT
jgi:hypothetical protein